METLTPSLDWGDELITSVLWVAKAWVIGAAGMVVVLALLGRFTTWGRQFWRVTGGYFKGPGSLSGWVWPGGPPPSGCRHRPLSVPFHPHSPPPFSPLPAPLPTQR